MKVAWPYQTLRFAINNSHMPCVVIEPIFVCVMCLHELKTVQAKSRNEKALEVFAYASAITPSLASLPPPVSKILQPPPPMLTVCASACPSSLGN